MEAGRMRLKLDENISRHLKPTLISLGHDVDTVEDEHLLGESDEQVARAANQNARMLFTLDVGFAYIRKHPPGAHPGIVLFRPPEPGALGTSNFIEAHVRLIDLRQLHGCIAVVEPGRVRIRRLSTQS